MKLGIHGIGSTAGGLLALALWCTSAPGGTLDAVKTRGELRCGVSEGIPGFSMPDATGRWRGLDVDVCRAVAAVVLGDADKVSYASLSASQRFEALAQGRIDVLARNTTWTMSRETVHRFQFAGINYFDGQGFMVPRRLGVRSALGLDDHTVCVKRGTTSEVGAQEYFDLHEIRYRLLGFETLHEALEAYEKGRCEVVTSDQSQLYGLRTLLAAPDESVVLPEFITKEPLGPLVRDDDVGWLNVVRWTLAVMINAEEMGIDSDNVARVRTVANRPEVRHLLDVKGDLARSLGVAEGWALRVLEQVGNYGESFQRNLGKGTPVNMSRGQNAPWNQGGLLYAPPVR